MRATIATVGMLMWAQPSIGQRVNQETPKGIDRTVPVGGVVWEKASFDGAPGVTIAEGVHANWGSAEIVSLPPDANLIIIREKKTKACRQQTITTLSGMSFGGWKDCLIDTDGDGRFDRVSFNEVAGAKDISPPVPYTVGIVPVEGGQAKSFRQTITYLGKSGPDLRLSYREFANDLARPAFTEELSVPVPSEFPQAMQIKEITLTILGIGPSGLTYRIN